MHSRGHAIGEAARIAGVKVPTIRYYEDIGLMPPVARNAGNRRLYGAADLRRLTFIRHARELGFEVEAIRMLLSLRDDPGRSCAAADTIAKARLADVVARIERLTALRAELESMVTQCALGRIDACRVIETLADAGHDHGRLADR
jgi:DNA-binding transcriptional MerR regulator